VGTAVELHERQHEYESGSLLTGGERIVTMTGTAAPSQGKRGRGRCEGEEKCA